MVMCGIGGYWSRGNKSLPGNQVVLALYALQHRGQESCGVAVKSNGCIRSKHALGLAKDGLLNQLTSDQRSAAIGFVRYPTRNGNGEYYPSLSATQPFIISTLQGPQYAIASNGDIINYENIVCELREKGVYFYTQNDGELLGRFIVYYHEQEELSIVEAIDLLMKKIKGAYSALFLSKDAMYAFRDPSGFRPMWLGDVGGDTLVASETCALDLLQAGNYMEVEPGSIVKINDAGVEIVPSQSSSPKSHCIFELIYFARPDSNQYNEYVYKVRQQIGACLAAYDTFAGGDWVVVPVPDSANFIAQGYAATRHLPLEFGLIRNHYVGRTFIRPDQVMRDECVEQKFNPLPGFFIGKRVILVDDSIVRGTTLRKLVKLIKDAGAKEVHLRIGSPPVRHSCYYGIDTPARDTLLAREMPDVGQMNAFLGSDSLKFLAIGDLKKCVSVSSDFCYACFDGRYPIYM